MEKQRVDYKNLAPDGYKAMLSFSQYGQQCGLEPSLLELVKIRASQINGCSFCLDMHTKDARASGETEQRLYLLDAWRDAPFFSGRERAALAWTEAVTLVAQTRVPDEIYQEALRHFSEKELVDLTFVVVAINSWNRLSVSFRVPTGIYKPVGGHSAMPLAT